jgi:hypothetical protein
MFVKLPRCLGSSLKKIGDLPAVMSAPIVVEAGSHGHSNHLNFLDSACAKEGIALDFVNDLKLRDAALVLFA